jgi:hypothetical protein
MTHSRITHAYAANPYYSKSRPSLAVALQTRHRAKIQREQSAKLERVARFETIVE